MRRFKDGLEFNDAVYNGEPNVMRKGPYTEGDALTKMQPAVLTQAAANAVNAANRAITGQAGGAATGTPQGLAAGYAANMAAANKALEDYRNGQFNYDFNVDPTYRQARNAYMEQGRLAARDAAANAASLTGGYGNSYGTMAAQQQYNAALQRVNDIIPELEANAYNRYRDEQNQKLTLSQMYLDMANRDMQMAQLGAQYNDYSGLNGLGIDTSEYESKEQADREWELIMRNRQQEEWTQEDEARAIQIALQKAQYKDYSALEELGWDMSSQKQQDLLDEAILRAQYNDYSLLKELGFNTDLLEAQKAKAMAAAYGYGGSGGSGSGSGGYGGGYGYTSGATSATANDKLSRLAGWVTDNKNAGSAQTATTAQAGAQIDFVKQTYGFDRVEKVNGGFIGYRNGEPYTVRYDGTYLYEPIPMR